MLSLMEDSEYTMILDDDLIIPTGWIANQVEHRSIYPKQVTLPL